MYEKIKSKPHVFELYSQKLIKKGTITQEYLDNLKNSFTKHYEEEYKKVISDQLDTFKKQEL